MIYSEANHFSFVQNDTIHSVGGSGYGMPSNSTYSKINKDGTLETWMQTTSIIPGRSWVTGANTDKYIYIMGGIEDGTYNNTQSVFVGNLQPNGDILNWRTTTSLPQPLSLGGSVIIDNNIFYVGGDTESHSVSFTATDEIYTATINDDGSLGDWSIIGKLPEKLRSFGFFEYNSYFYVVGGYSNYGAEANVWRAKINESNYALDPWEEMYQLPTPIWVAAYTRVGNTIIVAGGRDDTSYVKSLHYTTINPDGTISPWIVKESNLPDINGGATISYWNNNLYLLGGHNGVDYFNTVYFGNLSDILGTPIPVTKTVFAPGITASWNADALINCDKNSTSEWTLAPYAEDVYRPLIQALQESGTNLLEFYYDWRKNPVDTSEKLASMVEGKIIPYEKVNYVGHSMGGLVGKNYLDTTEGSTIANFLTIGTPYKGSALAYPPWEGGDVWSNNLLEKIAITLYLKHCGDPKLSDRENIRNIVPSLQSLLPTEEYLRGKNEIQPKLPLDASNQNNWFANMSQDSWDVRVGNIVGKSIETLQIIRTKDPNKKEKLNGDWIDGKPAGRINSDGDGTVLATSAVLDNADEIIDLNQTHRGLVNSVEGMSAVLKFLNLPENIGSQTSIPLEEPNSALIVIGYPADFVITDQNGKSKNAKDGIVAVMNPKSGNYKLNLLSKSGNTQLIVAQFLPNGEVKYKEYNFKGIGPKFKTLKFNLQNPKEDILTP